MESKLNVTRLLHQWHDGESKAFDDLVNLVYQELSTRAHRLMRRESDNHPLQTDALINEAYLRLIGLNHIEWENRKHFFAVAASVMRRILVDQARARKSWKRGGEVIHVTFDYTAQSASGQSSNHVDLVALDNALNRLAAIDPLQESIVELRYFTGLSNEEIADQHQVSVSTIKRKWQLARAWLYRELHPERQ